MRDTPIGWPRISTALYYEDPARTIDWLCEAFGFEVQTKIVGEGGTIEHSELRYGDGLIMVGAEKKARPDWSYRKSPRSIDGANTQSMMVYVDDAEGHCACARRAGAVLVSELKVTDYGPDFWADLGYEVADLEGHHWWFYQRLRDPPK